MKLSIILEMPLKDYYVDNIDGFGFTKASRKAIKSPKVLDKISRVLSRLTNHNITIVAASMEPETIYGVVIPDKTLVKMGLKPDPNGIIMMLLWDGSDAGHNLTPWLILHQFGEAWLEIYGDLWGRTWEKYKKEIDPSLNDEEAFFKLFKMRSARTQEGGTFAVDTTSEIITEFLWHGGKLRMNILNNAVKKMRLELMQTIDDSLYKLHGKVLANLIEY